MRSEWFFPFYHRAGHFSMAFERVYNSVTNGGESLRGRGRGHTGPGPYTQAGGARSGGRAAGTLRAGRSPPQACRQARGAPPRQRIPRALVPAASQPPDEVLRWLLGGSRGILVKTGSANNGSGDLPHQSGGREKRDGKRNGIYGKGGVICAQPSGLCAPGRGKSAGAGRFYGKPDRGYGLRDGHPVGGAFKPGL